MELAWCRDFQASAVEPISRQPECNGTSFTPNKAKLDRLRFAGY